MGQVEEMIRNIRIGDMVMITRPECWYTGEGKGPLIGYISRIEDRQPGIYNRYLVQWLNTKEEYPEVRRMHSQGDILTMKHMLEEHKKLCNIP